MPKPESLTFPSFSKIEDQLLLAAFGCILLSFYFGLQPELLFAVLWAATGIVALLLIYFAFPNMWPYALLLYAIYAISAFGVILIMFWYDKVKLFEISFPLLIGIFLILAAFYMVLYIVQNVKKARDAAATKEHYLSLGFWSISVLLFAIFSMLSIFSWALWANSGGGEIQFYIVLEPLIALLLIYILWLPDRGLDWGGKELPQPPTTKYIVKKSEVLKKKVAKVRNICPECGLKLKLEKKACPSCNNKQTFGWCVKSEAYVLPCSHCGGMTLYGKDKCQECGKRFSETVECNNCGKSFPVREWASQT